MFVSKQKKEENVAEYVLYMWQIEDLIRACQFNIDKIEATIISPQTISDEHKDQLKQWYVGLCNKMKIQKIEQSGHLRDVSEVVDELSLLHNTLLTFYQDETYAKFFSYAEPYLEEFRKVSNNPNASNIEVFFNALYAKMILKLQNKEISTSTEQAFEAFRNVLALLASKYKQMQAGELG
ncbi:MAG: DUF4924 family protein [Flavobacteriales bacterium]|nr:DUF4924 family protein [Flavobacteriales bacterium]